MDKHQKQTKEFNQKVGHTVNSIPSLKVKEPKLWPELINEEFEEFKKAVEEKNIIKIADALGDLIYVINGAATAYGIDLDPILDEIHRSNMTKIGGHIREDGKVLKPESYEPPNIKEIILKQLKEDN
jgi:predicted HAD superfamily Cof-like phosphohydrolase